jgi:hypothetical protein
VIHIFAFLLAFIAQIPNSVPIGSGATLCKEPTCVIVSSTAPLLLQLVNGANGCPVALISPTLPLTVNYSTNTGLCPTGDPAPGVVKSIVAVQQASPYTITYSIGGVLQPAFTVLALPPPPSTQPLVITCTIPPVTFTYSPATNSFMVNVTGANCN